MTWLVVEMREEDDRSSKPVVHRVRYEGPHGPARAETQVMARKYGANGSTSVSVPGLPELLIEADYRPSDRALKRGVPGRLGDQAARLVRPRYLLTPKSRAIYFELEDGRRWALKSSGFARCAWFRDGSPRQGDLPNPQPLEACRLGRHRAGRGRDGGRMRCPQCLRHDQDPRPSGGGHLMPQLSLARFLNESSFGR